MAVTPEGLLSKPVMFGDFLDMNQPASSRLYRNLPSYQLLASLLEEYYMRITTGTKPFLLSNKKRLFYNNF